ncbi:MAG: sigma-70 family RNA polymerase sigma factor, partial [Chloroflexi bacterium]|nr:sigma-70 family RNA polymerase sigma factor [Chloroflexota bacterium]
RRGQAEAFNVLVQQYQNLVYSVALRLLANVDDAADATQDAFLSAYQAIGRFRGGSFRAWLLRITTNCCYDRLRAARRRPASPWSSLGEQAPDIETIADASTPPEEELLNAELMEDIQQGLMTLPEEFRAAVVLSDIQGMSYEEIAEVLGCSVGTVKSRLSRGRARLRDYLVQRELIPQSYRPNYREHENDDK